MGALRRIRELFPWTPFGVGVAAAALLGDQLFAAPEVDYVLRVVAGTALIAVIAMAVAAAIATAVFVRGLRRGTWPAVSGEAERGAVEASALPFWGRWLAMRLEVEWRQPRGARAELELGPEHERVERVRFDRRQGGDRVERRWRLEDPFGLAAITWTDVVDQRIRIAPHRGALDRSPELFALARGDAVPHPSGTLDGDPMDLRPYQVGDPLRLVAWKIYARTGELDVRVPERAVSPERRTAAYLVTGPDDEPAAAAAWVALERGLLGDDWTFGTDGEAPTSDLDEAKDALLRSGHTESEPAADLAAFVAWVRRSGPAHVVLFAPGRPGPWLERGLEQAGPDLTVLAVVDALAPTAAATPWWRKDDAPRGVRVVATAAELDTVCAAFERRGAGAVALARRDGRVLRTRAGARRWVA